MGIALRETTWVAERADVIRSIAPPLFPKKSLSCEVCVEGPVPTNIRVHTTEDTLLRGLEKMFGAPAHDAAFGELYFIPLKDCSVLHDRGYPAQHFATDCFGLYDEKERVGLIVGGTGYGLLKSVVIGIASACHPPDTYHPAHGTLVTVNGKGTLLFGAHGAGKTTLLAHLMKYRGDTSIRILTDDWALFSQDGESVEAVPLEKRISFRHDFAEQFPELELDKAYVAHALPGIHKAYVLPDELYGPGTAQERATLDKVAFLDPRNDNALTAPLAIDAAAQLIVETSYHMPDPNPETVAKHRAFWMNVLRNRTAFSLDSRHIQLPLEVTYHKILCILGA